jgi:hypothetical protein
MSGAKFDVKGESIDEERNEEESARQEKKEVAERLASRVQPIGPEQSGPIRFWRRPKNREQDTRLAQGVLEPQGYRPDLW